MTTQNRCPNCEGIHPGFKCPVPIKKKQPEVVVDEVEEVKPLTNGQESLRGFPKPRMKWTEHRG